MIVDVELDEARRSVLALFEEGQIDLAPRQIIETLVGEGYSKDLVRSANSSLVASGFLEITPEFKLHRVESALAAAR